MSSRLPKLSRHNWVQYKAWHKWHVSTHYPAQAAACGRAIPWLSATIELPKRKDQCKQCVRTLNRN